jgi:hypothetical protein
MIAIGRLLGWMIPSATSGSSVIDESRVDDAPQLVRSPSKRVAVPDHVKV